MFFYAYHASDDGGSSVDRPLPRPPRPKSDLHRLGAASSIGRWTEQGKKYLQSGLKMENAVFQVLFHVGEEQSEVGA